MRALRGLTRLQELSRRIVAAWDEAYEGARKDQHADAVLAHKVATIELPVRAVSEAEAAEARSKVEALSKDPRNRRRVVWHQDVVTRYERQEAGAVEPFAMALHAIRLGDIAIATNVFELFTERRFRSGESRSSAQRDELSTLIVRPPDIILPGVPADSTGRRAGAYLRVHGTRPTIGRSDGNRSPRGR